MEDGGWTGVDTWETSTAEVKELKLRELKSNMAVINL
jgi:hypothetical protein